MEVLVVLLSIALVVTIAVALGFRKETEELEAKRIIYVDTFSNLEQQISDLLGKNQELNDLIAEMKEITNKDREMLIDLQDQNEKLQQNNEVHISANKLLGDKVLAHGNKIETMAKAMGEDKALIIRFEKMLDYERARVKRAQKKLKELRDAAKVKPKAKKKK